MGAERVPNGRRERCPTGTDHVDTLELGAGLQLASYRGAADTPAHGAQTMALPHPAPDKYGPIAGFIGAPYINPE